MTSTTSTTSASATPVQIFAPAKLTLSLRVTGVRADGYHLIDAEMVALSLGDTITIDPGRVGVAATGPFAAGVPCDDSNLVVAALELAGRRAHVTIDKQVPHGGGLGGGSSDAAAVLRWAHHPTDPAGLEAAASIGADVPFCMVGGRARVSGIGEVVEPLPFVERWVTLVIPPLQVSTPAVYRAWDVLNRPTTTADGDEVHTTSNEVNDLEAAALVVEPRLGDWRDRIGALTGERPILAGSGATWFLHGRRDNALAALGDEGAQILVAHTLDAMP